MAEAGTAQSMADAGAIMIYPTAPHKGYRAIACCKFIDASGCGPVRYARPAIGLYSKTMACWLAPMSTTISVSRKDDSADVLQLTVVKWSGAPKTIRTSDLPLRRRLLCPAELPGRTLVQLHDCQ